MAAGWEDNVPTGWFLGRVARKRVTARDRQDVPTANYEYSYSCMSCDTLRSKQMDKSMDWLHASFPLVIMASASAWWVVPIHCIT